MSIIFKNTKNISLIKLVSGPRLQPKLQFVHHNAGTLYLTHLMFDNLAILYSKARPKWHFNGFLLSIACLVLQLHVCIRDDVLHASCDWQLGVCCLDCLALKRRVLEPPVFGACAECGMHWSCCCPPVLLLLVVFVMFIL